MAAMAAPSAGNQRPWHFIVVREKSTLARLSDSSPYAKCVKDAPLAIVVCGDILQEVHKGFWTQDCAAATQNMLIAVEEKGLGAVWVGIYPLQDRIAYIRHVFELPENIVPFSIIPVGYPDEKKEAKMRFDPTRIHSEHW